MFSRIANAKVAAGKITHSNAAAAAHNRRRVTIKEARFDEENLNKTKPDTKDYGLLAITESKTPYPRKENPVDATLLRDRLLEQLARRAPSLNSVDLDLNMESVSATSEYSSSLGSAEPISFIDQRKEFNCAEYTITKQRDMRDVRHPRGQSISADLTRASIFT